MIKHQISSESINGLTFSRQLAGAFGKGEHKELLAIVDPAHASITYEIYDHKKRIPLGPISIWRAVDKYNEI